MAVPSPTPTMPCTSEKGCATVQVHTEQISEIKDDIKSLFDWKDKMFWLVLGTFAAAIANLFKQ